MKIRIRGNSLRLRLMQSDVETLTDECGYKEVIDFGDSKMAYSIYLKPNIEAISASFKDNQITVIVPDSIGRHWANSDTVGMEHQQHLYGEEYLRILIEKDYKCLAERETEDESDAFPNPVRDEAC